MKTSRILIGAICTFMMTWAMAATLPKPPPATREVQVGINDAYIPGGFDSNSDVYVVASGLFPNGCYRWSRADVKNVSAFNHEVRAIASVTQGMCLMVLVPFNKEVRLGKFEVGTHTLHFVNGDGTYIEKTLQIEK